MRKPIEKRLLDPSRVRRIATGFSWLDRRFVHDGWIDRLGRDEILLYLFLVAVADQRGLSFYGDRTIGALLKLEPCVLTAARATLVEVGLIAFESPLYQILDLTPQPRVTSSAQPRSLAALFADVALLRSRPGGDR